MVYRAIGLMSGSSLDGLDIVFASLTETGGKWTYDILFADCYAYPKEWETKLSNATSLSALDYQLLHTEYGHYIGTLVNQFIDKHELHHKVHLVSSHGHTTFHYPQKKMTAQLGDGAAIAAVTELPVVSDLRSLDIAFGGQGAPIVPIGEKLLLGDYACFLNIGGIANVSINSNGQYAAFDICAANRVLNLLAEEKGQAYDAGGQMAASGNISEPLLEQLQSLGYYKQSPPKSLDNSFGTGNVYTLIKAAGIPVEDALRTYTEHICLQIKDALTKNINRQMIDTTLLITGGGAFNTFLIDRLAGLLLEVGIKIEVPDSNLVQYKEALIMALIGVLRWREEATVLSSVTGATQNSIGGALWLGNNN